MTCEAITAHRPQLSALNRVETSFASLFQRTELALNHPTQEAINWVNNLSNRAFRSIANRFSRERNHALVAPRAILAAGLLFVALAGCADGIVADHDFQSPQGPTCPTNGTNGYAQMPPGGNLHTFAAAHGTTPAAVYEDPLNKNAFPNGMNNVQADEWYHIPGCVKQTAPSAPQPQAAPVVDNRPAPQPPKNNSTLTEPYTVQPGDTLGAIALKLGTTVENLITCTGMPNPDHLTPGQKVYRSCGQ